MYNPSDSIEDYVKKLLHTPEGWLLCLISTGYLIACIFFDIVVAQLRGYGIELTGEVRIAFALMPLVLLATHLKFDLTAKTTGDRVLTGVVLVCFSAIPLIHIFR
jgi:hypothetical protein